MALAIIHTATRVIRRTTTDASPPLLSDETTVVIPDRMNLDGGPWALNMSAQLVAPSAADILAADTLPQDPVVQEIIDAVQAVTSDVSFPPKLRRALAGLLVLYNHPRRYGL